MKKTFFLVFVELTISLFLFGHLRFIGPDPYYSFMTFPQDARLFNPGSSFFFLDYSNRGWMGNLDFPEMSPAPGYVATEEYVVENFDASTLAEAGFRGNWFSPSISLATYVFDLGSIRIIPLVSGQLDMFTLNASGTALGNDGSNDFLIPFQSELTQNNQNYSVGLLVTTEVKNIPVGIILKYQKFREDDPEGFMEYTLDGVTTFLNRYNWGWSTIHSCSQIFGISTNIDSFWLDEYAQTDFSMLDITLGATFKTHQAAFHFRQQSGISRYFQYDGAEDVYDQLSWSDKLNKTMLRGYDVFKLCNIGKAGLYLVGLVEMDFTRNPVIYEGVELEDMYRENSYAVELLPFLHFDLPDNGFFRIGTSVSFVKLDYGYYEVWDGQEVYASGWMTYDWEQWWERSSYGDGFVFTNFSEADLELVISKKSNLVLVSHLWSHLTYKNTRRYYGDTESDELGVYHFVQSAYRKNNLRELWIGGTFGFQVGKRISLGLFVDLPVYYDLYRKTEIEGFEGDYFSGISNDQPAVKKPVRLRALVIINW